jgi:hypothetical protein
MIFSPAGFRRFVVDMESVLRSKVEVNARNEDEAVERAMEQFDYAYATREADIDIVCVEEA